MATLKDAATEESVALDAVADLLAIRGQPRQDWGEVRTLESVVELDFERRALQAGGWNLVLPSAEAQALVDQGDLPTDALEIGQLYRLGRQVLIVTRHLVLRLDEKMDDAAVAGFLATHKLTEDHKFRFQSAPNLIRVSFRAGDPFEVAKKLAGDNRVLWAQPDPVITPEARYTPSDPGYALQVHHKTLGCETAWGMTRGAGVRIAVIDMSFEITHPDLKAGILPESRQRASNGSWLDTANWAFPGDRHGTYCAGVVGARADNGQGGCGVAPEAGLLVFAVGTTSAPLSVLAVAFEKAKDADAHVVTSSVSQGGIPLSVDLKAAIDDLVDHGRNGRGAPVFWAAPNANVAISTDPVASYERVIAVGATDQVDQPRQAAHGDQLDFLAPGTGIFTTDLRGNFASAGGSSMAAPCAAGVAGLVLAVHPALRWRAVRRILRTTCDKIGGPYGLRSERNASSGWGRIHAGGAVTRASYLSMRNAPG